MYGSFTRCDDCALALDAIDPLTLHPEHGALNDQSLAEFPEDLPYF
nr:unnamed protein product [Digitaria exilis]